MSGFIEIQHGVLDQCVVGSRVDVERGSKAERKLRVA